MPDDNKQDFKKGMSNNFIWFLMAAFLFALFAQNFFETKPANVSFSYQLEHLVNLQLIQPEDSQKIALNDNLVTFSGKFRDHLTDEGKARFKYLTLLDRNHKLLSEQNNLAEDLADEKKKVLNSAEFFLQVTGQELPKSGYVVVGDNFNSPEVDHSIVVKKLPSVDLDNLKQISNEAVALNKSTTEVEFKNFQSSLKSLIRDFRSPRLGIGVESIKQQLRSINSDFDNVSANADLLKQIETYQKITSQLNSVSEQRV